MSKRNAPVLPGQVVHLILRGREPEALVKDDEDWRALERTARRMLFWCGGAIHGCRCERNELRFALEVAHASIGQMAQHLSGGYAIQMYHRYRRLGSIFKHYIALPIDAELHLDDLVLWLHRVDEPTDADPQGCWTAHSAYLHPQSSTWITTERVLAALGRGGPAILAYRRRRVQALDPAVVEAITHAPRRRKRRAAVAAAAEASRQSVSTSRPSIEEIARLVARFSDVPYDLMRSASRQRRVTKAKVIAAVLATRNGASVAAVARLFRRSRSTLIELVDRYRRTQPQLFDAADQALAMYLREMGGDGLDAAAARLPRIPGKLG